MAYFEISNLVSVFLFTVKHVQQVMWLLLHFPRLCTSVFLHTDLVLTSSWYKQKRVTTKASGLLAMIGILISSSPANFLGHNNIYVTTGLSLSNIYVFTLQKLQMCYKVPFCYTATWTNIIIETHVPYFY